MKISEMTMRTVKVGVCVAVCMSAGLPLLASPYTDRAFAGASVNYIIPSVDGLSKIENALGYKITAGYQFKPQLAFVFDYIIVPSMKNDEKATAYEYDLGYYYHVIEVERPLTEASFRSFCFSIRYSFNPLVSRSDLRPYVAGGLGSMRVKVEEYAAVPPQYAGMDWDYDGYEEMGSLSDLFFKFATGLEYQFDDDISLSAEVEYVMGHGDLDIYTHVAVGARFAYHF